MPIHRLSFKEGTVNMQEVEDTIRLSFLAAGILHGEATMRLCAGYLASHDKRTVVIRHESEEGLSAMVLAVGFCGKEFGDGSFTVEKVSDDPGGAPPSRGRSRRSR